MANRDTWNLVIAGVGGQGVILLNAVLGRAAARSGLGVATAETHGMAQRYGRVMIHLRIGDEVHGTLIPRGGADVLIGVEPLETLRSAEFCSGKTLVLMNRQVVRPPSLAMSWHERYPSLEEIARRLETVAGRVVVFDAHELAREAGAVQATNAVMLGALCASGTIPVAPEAVRDTLLQVVPSKATDINRRAFDLGGAWVQVSERAACLDP